MPAHKNTSDGVNKKKKKGRKPAHQNSFSYQHNPGSKKTDKILASPNEGCCQRCFDKIEWRKKYRKYKPLTQPSTCNICKKRNITSAYHTICNGCTTSEQAYARLEQNEKDNAPPTNNNENVDKITISSDPSQPKVVSFEADKKPEPKKSPETKKFRGRVCAICAKEPSRNSQASINRGEAAELEKSIARSVAGSTMKLRERRALERKLEKLRLEDKERKKLERRQITGGAAAQDNDVVEEEKELHQDSDSDVDESEDCYRDDEDEFLLAVGGKEKLLTGEAYQKKLMEKERL